MNNNDCPISILKKVHGNTKSTEIAMVANELLTQYQKSGLSEVPYLPAMMLQVAEMKELLIDAIKHLRSKSELRQLDLERDQSLKALSYFTLGMLFHSDATIVQAAQQLHNILDHYGLGIARESYSIESAYIDSLLIDLNKQEQQAAIAQLPSCDALVQSLADKQQTFKDTQLAYMKAKATYKDSPKAWQIRDQLRKYLNRMVLVFLNAMYLVDEPRYGNFVRTLAVVIDDNNRTVKRRQGKRSKETAMQKENEET